MAAAERDTERAERQDNVLAVSETLRLRLLAHAGELELFVATLKRRDGGEESRNDGTD